MVPPVGEAEDRDVDPVGAELVGVGRQDLVQPVADDGAPHLGGLVVFLGGGVGVSVWCLVFVFGGG